MNSGVPVIMNHKLSVTSRCSIEVVGRIELVVGMEASFDQSYTVISGIYGRVKNIRIMYKTRVLPSGTFS